MIFNIPGIKNELAYIARMNYHFSWEVQYWVKIQDFFFVAGAIFGITSMLFRVWWILSC